MSANAQTYLEEVVRSFAEIQTNLLLMAGEPGATEEQKFNAAELQETIQEVENNELKSLKESFE
jgi:hypothetical protein